jgi:MOSC domain-containing protein YiiM
MTVAAICYGPHEAAAMLAATAIEVVAGTGIVGDRYFSAQHKKEGKQITLIEAEEIESFNARNGTQLSLTDPRRNVITRGVRLAPFVGREFTVGAVRLRGIELCEPCGTLSGYLASFGMAKRDFVREFTHRCGLRADIVGSGTIRVGDAVAAIERPP